ncbi:MAG: hypothetical protein ACD_40C00002G0001 [uncultured bacterium]|nr:MAG: hypothetical protein ACD_40C00002G0001 [uncultured bacterium]
MNFFGLSIINLGEDDLLRKAERVVTVSVKGGVFDSAKIFDLRQDYSTQFIEEIKHFDTPQGDTNPNWVSGADFEASDRLFGTPNFGSKSSKGSKFGLDGFDIFR